MPTLAELGEINKAAWWNQGRLAQRAATRSSRIADRNKGVNVPWERKQDRRGFFDRRWEKRQASAKGRPHPSVTRNAVNPARTVTREAEEAAKRTAANAGREARTSGAAVAREFGQQANASSAKAAENFKNAAEEVSRNTASRAHSVGQKIVGEAEEAGKRTIEHATTTGARQAGANAAEGAAEGARRNRRSLAGTAALVGGAGAGGAAVPAIGAYEYKRARERSGNKPPKQFRSGRYGSPTPKRNVYAESYSHAYGQGNG